MPQVWKRMRAAVDPVFTDANEMDRALSSGPSSPGMGHTTMWSETNSPANESDDAELPGRALEFVEKNDRTLQHSGGTDLEAEMNHDLKELTDERQEAPYSQGTLWDESYGRGLSDEHEGGGSTVHLGHRKSAVVIDWDAGDFDTDYADDFIGDDEAGGAYVFVGEGDDGHWYVHVDFHTDGADGTLIDEDGPFDSRQEALEHGRDLARDWAIDVGYLDLDEEPEPEPVAPAAWSCRHKRLPGDAECPVCKGLWGRSVTSQRGIPVAKHAAPLISRRAQRQQWACVDLDGTILELLDAAREELFGDPLEGAPEALRELMSLGWRVSIYTARFEDLDEAETAQLEEALAAHLRSWQIPFSDIWTGRKPRCDVFIDDKAVQFEGDWDAILAQVAVIEAPKKPKDEDGADAGLDGLVDPLADEEHGRTVDWGTSIPRPPEWEGVGTENDQ